MEGIPRFPSNHIIIGVPFSYAALIRRPPNTKGNRVLLGYLDAFLIEHNAVLAHTSWVPGQRSERCSNQSSPARMEGRVYKRVLLGTPKREPQEYRGNIIEYEDPGRYMPIIFLLYIWGSLFGVPCLGFPVESLFV